MERLDAYIKTCKKLDLNIFPHYIKEGGYEREKTDRCVKELLALPDPPTAIIAANDLMALQVMDSLLKDGHGVPEDFSVVGFDDISIASHNSIQLTTVDCQARESARLVISNLLNLLEGVQDNAQIIKILLDPSLKVRNTTGSPRKRRR
jgi:DNA-binding LacI/PurR family transcriptional regulator